MGGSRIAKSGAEESGTRRAFTRCYRRRCGTGIYPRAAEAISVPVGIADTGASASGNSADESTSECLRQNIRSRSGRTPIDYLLLGLASRRRRCCPPDNASCAPGATSGAKSSSATPSSAGTCIARLLEICHLFPHQQSTPGGRSWANVDQFTGKVINLQNSRTVAAGTRSRSCGTAASTPTTSSASLPML
jgi:hypothetical protein